MKAGEVALAVWALSLAACDAAGQRRDAHLQAKADALASAPESQFPALSGRVVDQAALLSPGEESRLTSQLAELERRTSDQLVIVTIPSLGGQNIEGFSRSLGNHWGVGRAGKDNGVLLVVAPAERRTRIQVGYGLEPILTNARARAIVEADLVPNFREGRWHAGIESGARAIIATLIAHEREPRRGRQ